MTPTRFRREPFIVTRRSECRFIIANPPSRGTAPHRADRVFAISRLFARFARSKPGSRPGAVQAKARLAEGGNEGSTTRFVSGHPQRAVT
jgi:hypothetical protein